jgi:hypothetical protein
MAELGGVEQVIEAAVCRLRLSDYDGGRRAGARHGSPRRFCSPGCLACCWAAGAAPSMRRAGIASFFSRCEGARIGHLCVTCSATRILY